MLQHMSVLDCGLLVIGLVLRIAFDFQTVFFTLYYQAFGLYNFNIFFRNGQFSRSHSKNFC